MQEAGSLRGKKGYIELATQKSGTIFTTSRIRELSEKYVDLKQDYEKKQRHLEKEVVQIACGCDAARRSRLMISVLYADIGGA